LASPAANTRLSEFLSQIRPPQNRRDGQDQGQGDKQQHLARGLLTRDPRGRLFPHSAFGTSALMAYTRRGALRRHIGSKGSPHEMVNI